MLKLFDAEHNFATFSINSIAVLIDCVLRKGYTSMASASRYAIDLLHSLTHGVDAPYKCQEKFEVLKITAGCSDTAIICKPVRQGLEWVDADCCICSGNEFNVKLECGHHATCSTCFETWATTRLKDGHCDVTCPTCNTVIRQCVLQYIIPYSLAERVIQRSLDVAVETCVTLFDCPNPECSVKIEIDQNCVGVGVDFNCPGTVD